MSNPKIQALEFLLHENGLPWKENLMWAVYDETQPGNFRIERKEKPSPDESYIDISDVKQWYLRAADKTESAYRMFPNLKKRLNVGQAFEQHVKWVLSRIPKEHRSKNLTILSPTFSIHEKEKSSMYWGVFDRIASQLGFVDKDEQITILPESEMTTAYCVYTRSDIDLKSKKKEDNRQKIMLTIDLGASTTDLTVVRSTSEGELKSKSRDLADARKINSLKGDTRVVAGNWVDEQIAKALGIYPQIEANRSLLRNVEQSKVKVSKLSESGSCKDEVEGFPNVFVTTEILLDVGKQLVSELESAFQAIGRDLLVEFKNQSQMLEKMKLAHQIEEEITSDNIFQLLDYVFLAGGTSQLHGLRDSFRDYFGGGDKLNMLSVGPSFPLATTVGAGLTRLTQGAQLPKDARFMHDIVQLNGTLPVDAYLVHRIGNTRKNTKTKIFGRGQILSPLPVVGSPIDLTYENKRGKFLHGSIRVGKESNRPKSPPEIQNNSRVFVTPQIRDHKIEIRSDQLPDGKFWFPLLKYGRNKVFVTDEGLDVQHAEEVVVDLGMSKTVVALMTKGTVTFNRLNQEVAKMSERSKVVQKPTSPVEPPTPPDKRSEPIIVSLPEPQSQPSPHPKIPEITSDITMLPKNEFWSQLQAVRSAAKGLQMDWANIAKVLLSLSAREQAFLAGPPGAGKSFTSRVVSHLLGRIPDESYFEIPVQSHWENDDALFGPQGVLTSLEECDLEKGHRLILFDEINLTEPERYLMRCLQSMSSEFVSKRAKLQLPSIYILGTLNIDGSSRPPSPKMLDRFGLIEFEPQNPLDHKHLAWKDVQKLTSSLGLIDVDTETVGSIDKRLIEVVNGVFETVAKEGLQSDFLPSRRVADYLKKVWFMVEGTNMHGILSKDQVVDWLISTQILTRIAGPEEHVKPLIEWFQSWLTNNPGLPLTERRIALYERQLTLGFVSPWQ